MSTVSVERAILEREITALELVPLNDPAAAAEPALRFARRAGDLGLDDLLMRARLIHADVIGRLGDTAGSGSIARKANAWATANDDPYVKARSERLLSTFYFNVGDKPASLEHAIRAVDLLDPGWRPLVRADHLSRLAGALEETGSFDAARERYDSALRIAEQIGDDDLRIRTLNNRAWLEILAGEAEAAMQFVAQMRVIAERDGIALNASALDTVARAQMLLGRYAQAEQTLLPVLGEAGSPLRTEGNDLAELLLTVAECQRLRGATDRAQASLERARLACDDGDLHEARVRVMQQQAAVYAAQGQHLSAYEEHVRFHEASEALYSAERDARARALQAVFETEEAVRSSRQFREMSLRDPLTGLYNRRYADDRLPALLGRAREEAATVSIAIVDIDHFKRINDTVSHDAGDEVLRRFAPLLENAAAHGFAARMGGEEFLLVLPGLDAHAAVELCETLRLDIHDQPWHSVVGDLPVTISVGVVTALTGAETSGDMLAEADRRLYTSKRGGRDQVTGD